jgi:GTP:adenosylcobinamide-phosphate guanylyltransferase
MQTTIAILPAGGEPSAEDSLYPLTHGQPKALLPIAHKPMAQWVLDALAASPRIKQVVVIGLTPASGLHCADKPLDYISSAGNLLDNVRAGLRRVQELDPQATHALWASSDIPTITSQHVDWLLDQCTQSDYDFYYTVIERSVMERRFPASHRTYTHLKDVNVCGGDLNVLATSLASQDNPLWAKITLARKNVFRQAALIGLDTLFWLALRQVTLQQAEQIASQRLGVRGKALLCPYAELGMDVDKPFQYDIVVKDLEGRL